MRSKPAWVGGADGLLSVPTVQRGALLAVRLNGIDHKDARAEVEKIARSITLMRKIGGLVRPSDRYHDRNSPHRILRGARSRCLHRPTDGRRQDAPVPSSAERKRQLLHHAKQLFVTLGYHATTTEKIALAAGITEPVLYRHFASKKLLFLQVLQQIREATLERWRAESSVPGDPQRTHCHRGCIWAVPACACT